MKTINDVIENKAKGTETAEAEKAAIQTSTARCAEKKRGNIPQKVAGLLAATMLVTMFASCDDMNGTTVPEQDTSGDGDTTVNLKETTNNSETEEPANLEEIIASIPVNEYGMAGCWAEFPFEELFAGSLDYSLEKEFKIVQERLNNEEVSFGRDLSEREKTAYGLWELMREEDEWRSFGFKLKPAKTDDKGWTHIFVSTKQDIALLSYNTESETYVTGLYDGGIRNDLNIINEESLSKIENYIQTLGYDTAVSIVHDIFWGILLNKTDTQQNGGTEVSMGIWFTYKKGKPVSVQMNGISFMATGWNIVTYDAEMFYDLPDIYIDRFLTIDPNFQPEE